MVKRMLKWMLCLALCCVSTLACERIENVGYEENGKNTSEISAEPNESRDSGGKILNKATQQPRCKQSCDLQKNIDIKQDVPQSSGVLPRKRNRNTSSNDLLISKNKREGKKDSHSYLKVSLEEFIDCYNANYYNDKGVHYIQPYSEWYAYTQDFGRHQGDMHYEFTVDKKILTLPTITVYTPQKKTVIKELTVDFDDHSYTERMYRQYEEICFYTLKVFFPNMGEKKLTRLYKKLNKNAYDNIFHHGQGFHSDNPPSHLYYKNGVGIYPYFAYGESVRMCVIPVTKKVVKAYEKKGVKIHHL